MEPLKEMFNIAFYQNFAAAFLKIDAGFNEKRFLKEVSLGLESLSLNQRLRQTTLTLKGLLPENYDKAIELLMKVIPHTEEGYTNLVFPDFVGLYGHSHFELSMRALKYFTRFGSSEFAIREFLKRDFNRTIKVMQSWAMDADHHVRRLASEGSRPRLPWSFKLDEVIKNPGITRNILETLKADEELYVRKSVANHLNDISKADPDYFLELVKSWDKSHVHTFWIIKHGSRSLIKKGNAGSLSVFNFEKNVRIGIEKFKITQSKIKLGESLHFEFDLVSMKSKNQKLVIDYLIYYRKKSGELSPKVFKLKELILLPKQKIRIGKTQLFKELTTRKHFAGIHTVGIQVNGKILHEENFNLIV